MSIQTSFLSFTLAATLLCSAPAVARAAAIQPGVRIAVTASTFALPIEIVDGAAVASWTVDLVYDASDVQIAVGCDPFVDAYCSFLTGPVTEGGFFADGAPFNLLVPGFVELDPITLEQAGRLSGVHGAYGGPPLGPSGDGVLAYVLFTTIGDGTSPITVESGALSEVPEPASILLIAVGLPALGRRLLRARRLVPALALASAVLAGASRADAQTVAVGPYYATPSWDQKLACSAPSNCPRFVVLSNWGEAAVLDRETGLVWQRSPSNATVEWYLADSWCRNFNTTGGRYGWRLPSPEELLSLADPGNASAELHLPAGHPFIVDIATGTSFYTSQLQGGKPLSWDFRPSDFHGGYSAGVHPDAFFLDQGRFWCVRGPR